jgi:hypothetical protein
MKQVPVQYNFVQNRVPAARRPSPGGAHIGSCARSGRPVRPGQRAQAAQISTARARRDISGYTDRVHAAAGGDVSSGSRHSGPDIFGVTTESDAAIVRHIEPFMGICRPRVRLRYSRHEIGSPGRCRRPQAKSSITCTQAPARAAADFGPGRTRRC